MGLNIAISHKNFGVLGVCRFWWENQPTKILIESFFSKFKVAECDPREGNQTCSYGETPFRKSMWISFNINFPEILDYNDFDAEINIRNFLNEWFATGVKFSIETFQEEIKHLVQEKFEKSKFQNKNFRFLGLFRFWCEEPADSTLNRILFSRCRVAVSDPHEDHSYSYGETPFR